jgi:hypothetical protein
MSNQDTEPRRDEHDAQIGEHDESDLNSARNVTGDALTDDRPTGETRSEDEFLTKADGEAGQAEVQAKMDEAQEQGFVASDDGSYAEYAKRKNEALSLPEPAPLKSE